MDGVRLPLFFLMTINPAGNLGCRGAVVEACRAV
jgi:hypothetical protein